MFCEIQTLSAKYDENFKQSRALCKSNKNLSLQRELAYTGRFATLPIRYMDV